MEVREWCQRILSADTLEEKLLDPEELSDLNPGPPLIWKEPVRPAGLGFQRRTRKEKLPPLCDHRHTDKRAICLHRFAGHELLAVEMMAHALLAFPNAPTNFRKGLIHTLKEEQEHVKLYCNRLKEMGVSFGDHPLYRHFWNHTPYIRSPLHYISVMSLTLEMANLDFAPLYGASFEKHGDIKSSELMATILNDEIRHVRFGWRWLQHYKKEELSTWQTWLQSLPPYLSPKRAVGFQLNEEPRIKAGVSTEWIEQLRLA
ncbi:MAG: DUF455 family protein [Parachlamydiales bacterium]|nr:DUF455 family protein [Parachlamydiales bacterium]